MKGQVLEIDCLEPDVALSSLREASVFDEVALYGALIHVVGEDLDSHRPLIERLLHERDVEIRSMDIIAPSLEDVFISSIKEENRKLAFSKGA